MNLLVKTSLLFAIIAQVGLTATAQMYQNSIGLSIGTFRLYSLDEQASPLRYAGVLKPLVGLSYHHHSENSHVNLRLSGGAGTMNPERFGARTYTTTFDDGTPYTYQISSALYHLNLEVDYLRRIGPVEPTRLTTWVGGSFQESLLYADEVANFPWVVNTATLSPLIQSEYRFAADHSLTLRVDMAVLGLITRAIWANFPKSTRDNNVTAFFKQGTNPATVNKMGKVNVQLGYTYRISPRFSLGAMYRARYLSYPDPRPIRALTSSVSLEGEIHF